MLTPSYVALSSQAVLSRQMDVVANNIANASTPAYKAERMVFQQYLAPAPDGSDPTTGATSFVRDAATYRDTRQGPLKHTGNDLDVAIDGPGYLVVQTPAGNRYTRDGHLQIGADGSLVTPDGYPVLGEGDQPLTVPQGTANVVINQDGNVSTATGLIGKIQIVSFADEQQVEASAGGLYVSSEDPTPAQGATLRQGMLEDSNVQPVVELTRMMDISRSYTAATNLINDENDRIKNAIDKLSKTA